MRVTESLTTFPMEYWGAQGNIYGALAYNLSADSMFMLSVRNMPIGNSLTVNIFYANEYELDSIALTAYILSKELHMADGWRGYKYGLDFAQISEEDRKKLEVLLNTYSKQGQILGNERGLTNQSVFTKLSGFLSTDLDSTTNSTFKCSYYGKGKCLKTGAFCDLCQDLEDDTNFAQRESATQKCRSSPFTSGQAKLSENFRSSFRNH